MNRGGGFRLFLRIKLSQPLWLGDQAIEGKTILVWADEGLGEAIQFVRYVPTLAERGAHVILFVPDPLVPLVSGIEGVSQCVSSSARARLGFDIHCPIGSLPLAFQTRLETIPSPTSYLPLAAPARRQAWEARLGPHIRLRVGLVWSGNPTHKNDHNRSIPLRMLLSLFDLDATFVSLQKDPRPEDHALLRERSDIIDLTEHLADFVDTAALISCLDLVITVDTSVAHLAAALGCRTWIMLPYFPDFRWMLTREDSPGYPTAHSFRQTKTREYSTVLNGVRTELLTLVAGQRKAVQRGPLSVMMTPAALSAKSFKRDAQSIPFSSSSGQMRFARAVVIGDSLRYACHAAASVALRTCK